MTGERIAAALSLPEEVVLGLPLIALTGNRELYLENHKGLLEYGPERVRIATSAGPVMVEGEGLCLKTLTAESLRLTGRVSAVRLEEKK